MNPRVRGLLANLALAGGALAVVLDDSFAEGQGVKESDTRTARAGSEPRSISAR